MEAIGLGAAALRYAALGLEVFTLKPGTKRPDGGHGFKDGSRDPEQIRRWWTANRALNVGVVTRGLLVFDLDTKNGDDGTGSLCGWLAEQRLALPAAAR
jgi:hypothetical protein